MTWIDYRNLFDFLLEEREFEGIICGVMESVLAKSIIDNIFYSCLKEVDSKHFDLILENLEIDE